LGKRVAIYPGSFDPPTEGHLNIVKRSVQIFDEVIVAVSESIHKKYMFGPAERVAIWKSLLKDVPRTKVDTFRGLLVDYVRGKGTNIILRGLRNVTDFEYEIQMATTNRVLNDKIETVFIMTEGTYSHIAASLIKEVVSMGGSAKGMVPRLVEKELRKKILESNKK